MTLTIEFDRETGIQPPNGGTVWFNGTGSEIPDTFGRTPTGALFGPLELGVPSGAELEIESVTFAPGDGAADGGDGILPITVVGAAATVPVAGPLDSESLDKDRSEKPTTRDLSRRGVLTLLTALGGAAALAHPVAGDDDELVTLSIAKIDVADVDAPFTVRVLDLVDAVLPDTTEVLVDQDATRVGEITDPNEPVILQDEPGEVRIYIRDSIGVLAQLLAWARSLFSSDSSLAFSRTFPDDKDAADFEESQFVTLTEHPAIVEPVVESGPERTVFEIGTEPVPHVDEGTNELGGWDIVGDALIYDVGENPPSMSEWTITTQLNFVQALRH